MGSCCRDLSVLSSIHFDRKWMFQLDSRLIVDPFRQRCPDNPQRRILHVVLKVPEQLSSGIISTISSTYSTTRELLKAAVDCQQPKLPVSGIHLRAGCYFYSFFISYCGCPTTKSCCWRGFQSRDILLLQALSHS